MLSAAEVFDLADRMKHPRYRALILLSVFGTDGKGDCVDRSARFVFS